MKAIDQMGECELMIRGVIACAVFWLVLLAPFIARVWLETSAEALNHAQCRAPSTGRQP